VAPTVLRCGAAGGAARPGSTAALVRSLGHLPEIDGSETTVSAENDQSRRHRVFCDNLLPDRRRCTLRVDYDEPCAPA
jgi:hypothetical protein